MTVPYTKQPLTFEQQLDLLADRGLEISDRSSAVATLATISYYRFSAYCLAFKDEHGCFYSGTNFCDILKLYEFDRRLRIAVMDALERVEVAVRTSVTYTLAHAYGAFGHHDPANFRTSFQHAQWLAKLTAEVEKSHEQFILHYMKKYDGFPRLPIWMQSEVMTFGSLSRVYEGMNDTEQQQISGPCGVPHYVFRSWLRSLNFVRNVCAHHSRLWNREISVAPVMPKRKHGWPPEEIPDHKSLFAILVVLGYLLDRQGFGESWRKTVTDLLEPAAATARFRIAMGLPEEWKSHRRWNAVAEEGA